MNSFRFRSFVRGCQANMAFSSAVGDLVKASFEETDSSRIFEAPVFDRAVLSTTTNFIRPITSYTSTTKVIEFVIHSSAPQSYIDLHSIKIFGNLQVLAQTDESGTTDDDNCALINFFGGTLFENIQVFINGILTQSLSSVPHSLKNYVETLISFPESCKKTHLFSAGWLADDVGKFDTFSNQNAGHHKRQALTVGKKKAAFVSKLADDLFTSNRLLPPNCKLTIKCTRSSHDRMLNFPVATAKQFHVHLSDLELSCNFVELDAPIVKSHQDEFAKGKLASFPFLGTALRNFSLAQGAQEEMLSNIYTGKLPTFVLIYFQNTSRFTGQTKLNPLKLDNPGLRELSLRINGAEFINYKFDKADIAEDPRAPVMYERVFEEIGLSQSPFSNDVTFQDWASDSFFLAVDLTASKNKNEEVNALSNAAMGRLDVQVSLHAPLTQSYTMIVHGTFPQSMNVGAAGDITVQHLQ